MGKDLGVFRVATLIRDLDDLLEVSLQNLQGTQLLLLILDDRLGRNHLLRHSRCDQNEIFLADLNPALFRVELTDAYAIARLLQVELFGFVLGELDDIEPGDVGRVFPVGFEHAGWAIE